ncbi:MAG TPA: hypothetical protein V6C65_34115 [Allocoleopsis sp.]
MKLQSIFLAVATSIITSSIGSIAKADTVKARCDIYPRGEDQASAVVPCTFSQSQGHVSIELQNGTTYDLVASSTEAAVYTDQDGNRATRDDSLGDAGLIYRLVDESVYVYWDATIGTPEQPPAAPQSSTPGNTPTTYVTPVQDDELVMQITEGEFRFHGYLERTSDNIFVGTDDQVQVTYDRDAGRVIVVNKETGTEFYNYIYSEVNEGK